MSAGQGSGQVGYGKPPAAGRFQKGRSGNPRGRPRKNKPDYRGPDQGPWLGELLLDEVYRPVDVREGGKRVTMTAVETALRALVVSAAKGSRLHIKLLLDHMAAAERDRQQQREALFTQALRYKAEWAEACRLAAERGTVATPAQLPHPDDVITDLDTGTVRIDGPRTAREQREVDERVRRRDELVRVLHQIEARSDAAAGERDALAARILEIDRTLPERLQLPDDMLQHPRHGQED